MKCQICLAEGVRMHSVIDRNLQELYEKLAEMPRNKKPLQVCYMCYARLQNCYRVQAKCLKSEAVFNEMMMSNDLKPALLKSDNTFKIVHPLINISCGSVAAQLPDEVKIDHKETMEIKVEKEEIEDSKDIIMDQEVSNHYTEQQNIIVKTEDIDMENENTPLNVHVREVNDDLVVGTIKLEDLEADHSNPSKEMRDVSSNTAKTVHVYTINLNSQ